MPLSCAPYPLWAPLCGPCPSLSLHCPAEDGGHLYLAPRYPLPSALHLPTMATLCHGSQAPVGAGGTEEAPWAGSRCCEVVRTPRSPGGREATGAFQLEGLSRWPLCSCFPCPSRAGATPYSPAKQKTASTDPLLSCTWNFTSSILQEGNSKQSRWGGEVATAQEHGVGARKGSWADLLLFLFQHKLK